MRGGGGRRLAQASRGRLRPAACARLRSVLGGQGFVGRSARSRLALALHRTARLGLLGLAALGDPVRLRSSPLPTSREGNPRHPARRRLLAWGERLKCARAGERDVEPATPPGRLALARSAAPFVRAKRWRSEPSRWRATHDDLARLRERISMSFPAKRGDIAKRGGVGVWRAMSGAARRAGGQGCRAQPAEEAEARCALCAAARVQVCYAPTFRRSPVRRAPSAVARRPQAVADRGTPERARLPRHPAPRGLRTPPPAGKPLRSYAKRQRRRHHTLAPRQRWILRLRAG